MDNVSLPPELEQYAAEAVATGRFRDVAEVVAAGLRLLRQADSELAQFTRSLEGAQTEADRDGWLSSEAVHAEMAALIDEARRAKA